MFQQILLIDKIVKNLFLNDDFVTMKYDLLLVNNFFLKYASLFFLFWI